MLSAVASLPDDEAIENMTADVVDDLLKRDVDTIEIGTTTSKIISMASKSRTSEETEKYSPFKL